MDCLFGMPGINHLKQKDPNDPDSPFTSPSSERTYQVWLRGRKSHSRAAKKLVGSLTNPTALTAGEYIKVIEKLKEEYE